MPIIRADVQWKKGPKARLPQLEIGVPAITTDTNEPFVGSPSGNIQLAKQEAVEQVNRRFDDLQNVDANAEMLAARGGEANLNARLGKVDAQLAQTLQELNNKANKTEINTLASGKRDKSTPIGLNDAASDLLTAIQGGTPVNVLSIPRDFSVTPIKTSFISNGKNLFDINAVKSDFILNSSGDETANTSNVISDYVSVKSGEKIYLTYNNGTSFNNRIVLYDSAYNKLETLSSFVSGDTITNANAAYFRSAFTKTVANNKLQIEKSPFTGYEPFYNKFSNVKLDQSNLTDLNNLNTTDKTSVVNAINELLSKINQGSESKRLAGKTIVCFGDSITAFGNYPSVIASRTGATVYNVGFGGTRLARHPTVGYDAFSMYRLVDSIVSGNWSLQDSNVSIDPNFSAILTKLKGIDFSTVDYITINQGRNDQAGDVSLGDAASVEDGYRYYGALKYIIRKIQSAFPKIKILFVTPAWAARYGASDLAPDTNSDVKPNSEGKYLYNFADAMKEMASKQHIPCYDFYRNCGVNEFNYTQYLEDGLHPNAYGYEHWGNKIASFILANV